LYLIADWMDNWSLVDFTKPNSKESVPNLVAVLRKANALVLPSWGRSFWQLPLVAPQLLRYNSVLAQRSRG